MWLVSGLLLLASRGFIQAEARECVSHFYPRRTKDSTDQEPGTDQEPVTKDQAPPDAFCCVFAESAASLSAGARRVLLLMAASDLRSGAESTQRTRSTEVAVSRLCPRCPLGSLDSANEPADR